jgi:hypothetical protein
VSGIRRLSENPSSVSRPFVDGVTRQRRTSETQASAEQAAQKKPQERIMFAKDCTLTSNVKAGDRSGLAGTNRGFRCDAAERFCVAHFIIRLTRPRGFVEILKTAGLIGRIIIKRRFECRRAD